MNVTLKTLALVLVAVAVVLALTHFVVARQVGGVALLCLVLLVQGIIIAAVVQWLWRQFRQ
jgi:hypothetical protein